MTFDWTLISYGFDIERKKYTLINCKKTLSRLSRKSFSDIFQIFLPNQFHKILFLHDDSDKRSYDEEGFEGFCPFPERAI